MEPNDARTIAEIAWRQFTGNARTDGNAGFFDAGGHSMALLRMAAWLKREHGRDLVLAKFLDDPTIDGLSRCLSEAGGAERLHTQTFGGGDRTIVCLPGAYGRAIAFERLADALNRRLGERVQLRCYELWNAVESLGVEDGIAAVREALRADLSDDGVIGLAGYSLGGMFAFIEDFARDRPDLHLWLIDSYPPIPARRKTLKALSMGVNALRAPRRLPGSLAASLKARSTRLVERQDNAGDGPSHPARWALHARLGELATHPWRGSATLIALRHEPLWTPYYNEREMNGLRGLLGARARRVGVPGSHVELLTTGVGSVSGVIADDLRAA